MSGWGKTAVSFAFVILTVAVVFLMFEVNRHADGKRDEKIEFQERLKDIARLVHESRVIHNPTDAFIKVIEAKTLYGTIVDHYAGIASTEDKLNIPDHGVAKLRSKINEQYDAVHEFMRSHFIDQYDKLKDEYDEDLSKMQGWTFSGSTETINEKRKRKKKKKQKAELARTTTSV